MSKKWTGPTQFEDKTGAIMMLPADLALLYDTEFKKIVELYAKDEQAFFNDFAAAFSKVSFIKYVNRVVTITNFFFF